MTFQRNSAQWFGLPMCFALAECINALPYHHRCNPLNIALITSWTGPLMYIPPEIVFMINQMNLRFSVRCHFNRFQAQQTDRFITWLHQRLKPIHKACNHYWKYSIVLHNEKVTKSNTLQGLLVLYYFMGTRCINI